MVYDCFTFFNELDILELRLNELSSAVDRFVLVEARQTFTLQPKPLYYAENQERFSEFADRIIHIVVDKFPVSRIRLGKVSLLGLFRRILTFSAFPEVEAWDIEIYQRNQIAQGINRCEQEDIIIISDVDEIPRSEKLAAYCGSDNICSFVLHAYYYFMNFQAFYSAQYGDPAMHGKPFRLRGPIMLPYRDFTSAQFLRKNISRKGRGGDALTVIEDGGWHFSFMGGLEKIAQKIEAFSHQEYNSPKFKDPDQLAENIRQGRYLFDNEPIVLQPVPLDESFPNYLLAHRELFSKYLIETE